jgi:hypothetical protein
LFVFGSNGGGEAFAFDMRFGANDVVEIPFIVMDLAVANRIAPTFTAFLEMMSQS